MSVEQHELADVGARTTDMEDIKLADDISTTSREPWEVVGQKSREIEVVWYSLHIECIYSWLRIFGYNFGTARTVII